jgi:molecular chaperone GrpE
MDDTDDSEATSPEESSRDEERDASTSDEPERFTGGRQGPTTDGETSSESEGEPGDEAAESDEGERSHGRSGDAPSDEDETEGRREPGSESESEGDQEDGDASAEQLAAIEETVTRLDDRLDTLESEFEEYRDVSERKRQEIKDYGVSEFATDMLKVRDSLENAIDMEDFDEGTEQRLRIVNKQFEQVFTSGRIERIDTDGQFDDRKHKAVETKMAPHHEPNEILEVREPGYRLEDKILRPARVVVAE